MSEYERLNKLFDRLFPLARSITGPGLRKSLNIMSEHIPLKIKSVRSGTQVFDWTVPKEWRIREAKLTGPQGKVYADFDETNLHVLNYSEPVDKQISLENLKPHLYSDPNNPSAIPYVTSYYDRTWGFSLKHEVLEDLPKGEYHAYIDSEFVDGFLNYAHTFLQGDSEKEILLSSYLCHPSLANNELSGPLVLSSLYRKIKKWDDRYYTYRFVLNPETIGSLVYLHEYGDELQDKLEAGLVLTCLGGPDENLSYKTTRQEDARVDKVVSNLNPFGDDNFEVRPFTPTGGSDERQYNSPGFNLPVGQMARTVYGEYEGYHNSKDDKEFMGIQPLIKSAEKIERMLKTFEYSGKYENTQPYGEPMLSKRELYPSVNSPDRWSRTDSSDIEEQDFLDKVLIILNYSDGTSPLVDIADKNDYSLYELIPVIEVLLEKDLLKAIEY